MCTSSYVCLEVQQSSMNDTSGRPSFHLPKTDKHACTMRHNWKWDVTKVMKSHRATYIPWRWVPSGVLDCWVHIHICYITRRKWWILQYKLTKLFVFGVPMNEWYENADEDASMLKNEMQVWIIAVARNIWFLVSKSIFQIWNQGWWLALYMRFQCSIALNHNRTILWDHR